MIKRTSLYIIVLFFSIAALISNYKNYLANIDQHLVLKAVLYGTYDFDEKFYNRLSSGYPTLTATAIPIKSITGAYWINKDSLAKGLQHLREGEKHNPYIGFSDMIFSNVYQSLNQKDSFAFYARRAFSKLPNNPAHYALQSKLYVLDNKIDSLSYFFEKISDRVTDRQVWRVYLAAMVANIENVDSLTITNNALKAKSIFNEKDINLLTDYILYGKDKINNMVESRERAIDSFDANSEYSINVMNKLIIEFDKNIENFETLAEMYFLKEEYNQVIGVYETLNELGMTSIRSPIVEFISISYLNIGDSLRGCYLARALSGVDHKLSPSLAQACRIVQ